MLFHLFMHSLVDSRMCPDQRWHSQPWHIRRVLQTTELPFKIIPLNFLGRFPLQPNI